MQIYAKFCILFVLKWIIYYRKEEAPKYAQTGKGGRQANFIRKLSIILENNQLKKEQGDNSTKIHHLCWAACIACMTMQKNTKTTYSATDVYYLCRSMSYSDKPSETYPHGSSAWIKFALGSVVNILPVKTTALSSSQVISILQQNKPILVTLVKPRSGKPDLGHAMVLFFYTEISSTSGQYIFMDPSPVDTDGGRVSVMLGASDMKDGSGLKITSRTETQYESWEKSFYKA